MIVCRRSRLSPFWLTSSRHVAVLVCRRFGVAVLACRRFDCTPSTLTGPNNLPDNLPDYLVSY